MLQIEVPESEFFDESSNEFVIMEGQTLHLEHSLISLAKWESKWHKPFLSKAEKTLEQTIDYVRCMTLNKHVDDRVYLALTTENFKSINAYIDDPMTATWFNERDTSSSRRISTAEVIYSQMIKAGVPLECEKWHLNRLMTLLRVCAIENNPEAKKMTREQILQQNRELNEQRRAAAKSKG